MIISGGDLFFGSVYAEDMKGARFGLALVALVPFIISGIGVGFVLAGHFSNASMVSPHDMLFMAIIPAAIGLVLLGIPTMSYTTRSLDEIAKIRATGRTGCAEITGIDSTHTEINGVGLYKVHVVVALKDRTPYRTTIKHPIESHGYDKYRVGSVHAVVQFYEGHPQVAFDHDSFSHASKRRSHCARMG